MSERQNSVSISPLQADLPTLEFRIPISPTDSNMRMVRYFLESVRCFGGPIARAANCVLSVGDAGPPFDLRRKFPWINNYNVEIHWVDTEQFRKWHYNATGFDRFWIQSHADVVAKIDADLLVAGDFDSIVLKAHNEQKVLGCMAHISPFGEHNPDNRSSTEFWADIYHTAGLEMPELTFQYAAWGIDPNAVSKRIPKAMLTDSAHRYGPAYFNAGVVIGPRESFELMGTTIVQDIDTVDRCWTSPFSYQIAHPICCARHGIPCEAISINYNFPMNLPHDKIRALNPDNEGGNQHKDTKIFHYIGGRKFFESQQTVLDLINDDSLCEAWPVFQARLREVHNSISSPHSLAT